MPESGRELYWNWGGPKAYSEADINSAIEAGALSVDSAERLKRHVIERSAPTVADEENFRLIGGFNDIFVAIASVLLLVAMGWLLTRVHGSLAALAVAATSWSLAEYFTRKKRLALTSIVLLLSFAAGVFVSIYLMPSPYAYLGPEHAFAAYASTALAAWLHWRRFHVPVSVACGVGAGLGLLFVALITAYPPTKDHLAPVFFCSGLVALGLAMHWDISDTARQTRRSDVAFWLHLLAAPLLVHPVFSSMGVFSKSTSSHLAWTMVGLYIIIGLVSLIIDRRALMISSLAYVLYALSVVFNEYGVVGVDLAIAALIIGTALLLLAALWQPARAGVVGQLPQALQRRLPPVRF